MVCATSKASEPLLVACTCIFFELNSNWCFLAYMEAAQARLSLHLSKYLIVGMHMLRLISMSELFIGKVYFYILTHTSNAKCFRNVTLINIRGLAKIIVPVRRFDSHSPKQVMIKRD